MAAAISYALRRTSARVVLLVGGGGLLLVLFRVLGLVPLAPSFGTGTIPMGVARRALPLPPASSWDVAAATLVAALAVMSAVVLYRER